jgi:hypothetical protein
MYTYSALEAACLKPVLKLFVAWHRDKVRGFEYSVAQGYYILGEETR